MDGRFEIIDAFVDGEAVDPAALKRALSEPEGRDSLIDAWLLRGVVQDEMALDAITPPRRAPVPARRPWVIAAAVAGVCLVGGYVAGTRFPNAVGSRPAEAPPVETTAPPSSSFPLPPATRVIRLELDPAWTSNAGGR